MLVKMHLKVAFAVGNGARCRTRDKCRMPRHELNAVIRLDASSPRGGGVCGIGGSTPGALISPRRLFQNLDTPDAVRHCLQSRTGHRRGPSMLALTAIRDAPIRVPGGLVTRNTVTHARRPGRCC